MSGRLPGSLNVDKRQIGLDSWLGLPRVANGANAAPTALSPKRGLGLGAPADDGLCSPIPGPVRAWPSEPVASMKNGGDSVLERFSAPADPTGSIFPAMPSAASPFRGVGDDARQSFAIAGARPLTDSFSPSQQLQQPVSFPGTQALPSTADGRGHDNDEGEEEADAEKILPPVTSDLAPEPPRKLPSRQMAAPSPELATTPTRPMAGRKKSPQTKTRMHILNGAKTPVIEKKRTETAAATATAAATPSTAVCMPVIEIPTLSPTTSPFRDLPRDATLERKSEPAPSQPSTPMSVSIVIPAMPPSGSDTEAAAASAVKAKRQKTTPSPVVHVGRRSGVPIGGGSGGEVSHLQIQKGRPKGWKPGMSYREVALRNLGLDEGELATAEIFLPPPRHRLTKTAAVAEGPKRRGRPPVLPRPRPPPRSDAHPNYAIRKRIGRPPLKPMEQVQREILRQGSAVFVPFLCEWAGCRAELQNMATLRTHVRVVHGQEPVCRWRRCATAATPVQFQSSEHVGLTEATYTDKSRPRFHEHMEYWHLEPVEWHQGDGVSNSSHLGPPSSSPYLTKVDGWRGKRVATSEVPNGAMSTKTNKGVEMSVGIETGVETEMEAGAGANKGHSTASTTTAAAADSVPKYLLNGEGKQVTPLVRDRLLESSALSWTHEETGRQIKDMLRQLTRRSERGSWESRAL